MLSDVDAPVVNSERLMLSGAVLHTSHTRVKRVCFIFASDAHVPCCDAVSQRSIFGASLHTVTHDVFIHTHII